MNQIFSIMEEIQRIQKSFQFKSEKINKLANSEINQLFPFSEPWSKDTQDKIKELKLDLEYLSKERCMKLLYQCDAIETEGDSGKKALRKSLILKIQQVQTSVDENINKITKIEQRYQEKQPK